MGVNAIARAIKRTPSSCFNILKTLVAEQVVEFDCDTKAYYLGRGMGVIARHAMDPNATYTWMRHRIERLADDWSLTVALWRVVHDSRLVLIGYTTAATSLRIHLTIGQRQPLLAGATGQCIAALSTMSDEQIAAAFPELRWDDPPTLSEYMHQIDQARLRNWGFDDGRFQRGVTSIATSIVDGTNRICYCLSATMFAGQLPTDKLHDLAAELLDMSSWATRELMPLNN